MKPYKVLVVDDSAFMRKMIKDIIEDHVRFEVVATARNGLDAIEKIRTLQPDVVTLDVEMPVMDGIDALQKIIQEFSVPVLMISSLTQEGATETVKALELGAFDFVPKPSGSISLDIGKVKEELHEKLQQAIQSKKKATPAIEKSVLPKTEPASKKEVFSRDFTQIVAIGTSTGGPRALNKVISELPKDFPAPVVIVQHMPPRFTQSLAMRLDTISNIHVVEAEHGMPLQPGVGYVAPGGKHLTIERGKAGAGYRAVLNDEAPVGGHKPSVDVLFDSLTSFREVKRHAVLMTGMGKDGALGMKNLKEAGAVTTIAEDEATCIVYGMPKAAIELGVVDRIVPVDRIAEELIRAVMK